MGGSGVGSGAWPGPWGGNARTTAPYSPDGGLPANGEGGENRHDLGSDLRHSSR